MPTGHVVVLGYFRVEWDTPNPPKSEKISPHFKKNYLKLVLASPEVLF